MSDLVRIPPMNDGEIARVRALEVENLKQPQVEIATEHVFHAGLYARSIVIPAGVLLTGALIKCATLLIISGNVIAYIDGEAVALSGYNVVPASAGRKTAFVALIETHMTMLFATDAATVAEAEAAFTDEAETLMSRQPAAPNSTISTGG